MDGVASIGAVVLAAGRGERMGADKALLDLGGETAIERLVRRCLDAGLETIRVVRSAGAAPLPEGVPDVVTVAAGGEMLDSIRAGLAALPGDLAGALVFPVDYAMVGAAAVRRVAAAVADGAAVALPIAGGRPGHPIGLARAVFAEVDAAATTLREVIGADRDRVLAVPVDDPWVRHDLDTPDDLAAARAALRAGPGSPSAWMRAHRSRRAFHPDPIPDAQLEWLVDSARYASTSSFIQAYSVVAVRDPERKAAVAKLCDGQRHIEQAPVFLAICADLYRLKRCCDRHGAELRHAPAEAFVEALIDAALMAQNLLLAAESEGLGGCMIGAARQHPRELAALLALPRHVFVAFGMVLGRPADDPPARGRLPLRAVLHREQYDAAHLDEDLATADERMRVWARAINAQGGYDGRPVGETKGWTDRMAAKWSRDFGLREALAAHLRSLGFGLM